MRVSSNENVGDIIKNLDGFVGDFLGKGVGRRVYRWNMGCLCDGLSLVVKFAMNSAGVEENFTEGKFWDCCPHYLKKYFCRVYGVSAGYQVLLMQEAIVGDMSLELSTEVTDELEKFFVGDFGAKNLGLVKGDLKIVDYGLIDFVKVIKNVIK